MKRCHLKILSKLSLYAFFSIGVLGYAGAKPKTLRVKGVLNWSDQKQTITSCENKKIYSLRILASNPHFHVSQRVKELEKGYSGSLVADIEGEVSATSSQLYTKNLAHDLLISSKVHSIERGQCP